MRLLGCSLAHDAAAGDVLEPGAGLDGAVLEGKVECKFRASWNRNVPLQVQRLTPCSTFFLRITRTDMYNLV